MTSEPANDREIPRVPLIVNPAAGRGGAGRHAGSMRRLLESSGRAVEPVRSEEPGHVAALVREAAAAGCREVLVAGGDGTVREALNAILGDGLELSLGVIPAGTGNDFIKSLGTPRSWRNACAALAVGLAERRRRRIDAGRCNGEWFANSVGIGLDALVVSAADRVRWLPGLLAYPAALALVLRRGVDAAQIRLEADGHVMELPASMVIACNGAWFGGLFHIAPPASLDDGLLSVVIASPLSRRRVLTLVPRAIRGTHLTAPEAILITARELTVETSVPLPLEADGEAAAAPVRRLEVSCVPGALSVIA
ncbi:MAG TPA: diacylglycerol kinase family protein [Woeseiaceae bacterium]|nr:diacylglycerol kinase family protein [Woeseiaceae bacterium]